MEVFNQSYSFPYPNFQETLVPIGFWANGGIGHDYTIHYAQDPMEMEALEMYFETLEVGFWKLWGTIYTCNP